MNRSGLNGVGGMGVAVASALTVAGVSGGCSTAVAKGLKGQQRASRSVGPGILVYIERTFR